MSSVGRWSARSKEKNLKRSRRSHSAPKERKTNIESKTEPARVYAHWDTAEEYDPKRDYFGNLGINTDTEQSSESPSTSPAKKKTRTVPKEFVFRTSLRAKKTDTKERKTSSASDHEKDEGYETEPNRPQQEEQKPNKTRRRRGSVGNLVERLYREAESKIEDREKAKRSLEEMQLQQYKFQPKTNKRATDMTNYKPLHERVGEIQKTKNEKIKQQKLDQIQNASCSFSPKINPISDIIARSNRVNNSDDSSIPMDLYMRHQTEQERKERLRRQVENQQKQSCTFEPQLSRNTDKILKTSQLYHGGRKGDVDFMKRQEIYKMKRKEKEESNNQYPKECTFKPKIAKSSESIVHSKMSDSAANKIDRITKLAVLDKEKSEELKELLTKEFYSQYDHKPRINKISKLIGRTSSIDDLSSTQSKERAIQELKAMVDQEFHNSHTFKPKTFTNYAPQNDEGDRYRITGGTNSQELSSKIEEIQNEKEQKLEELRRKVEYEQLQGCTFEPKTNRRTPRSEGPVVIKGLSSYLERTEFAKKMKQEQKEREENAFKAKAPSKTLPYTVPEPFNLYQNYNSEIKKSKLIEQAKENETKECTFKPKIKGVSTRELIDRILKEEDEHEEL
eukprot:gb/GECH01000635.1/.p1 GENE.gb/GECH01000635.1/~~gb/GECH01000635.1/.p1  ORF type:complete len:620 (+),score=173.72 gb/GECH01000635.1/:1-1860(+)